MSFELVARSRFGEVSRSFPADVRVDYARAMVGRFALFMSGLLACSSRLPVLRTEPTPAIAPELRPGDEPADEAAPTAELSSIYMSEDLSWILQYGDSEGRLWQVAGGRPTLRWTFTAAQIDRAELGREGRLYVLTKGILTLIDPIRDRYAAFDDVVAFTDLGTTLVLTGTKLLRTVDSATLQQRFMMAVEPPIEDALSRPARLLLGGRVLLSGDAMVDLTTGKTLTRGLDYHVAFSEDESRYLTCGPKQTVPVRDTATGQQLASLPSNGTSCGYINPALTPDGRYVLQFGTREDRRGVYRSVLSSYEISSGKTRSYRDPQHSVATALGGGMSFDQGSQRVCVDFGNYHFRARDCLWSLDKRGTPFAVKPRPAPPLERYGLTDPELGRAESEDGSRVLVATFTDRTTKNDEVVRYEDLHLHVFDAVTKQQLFDYQYLSGRFYSALPGGTSTMSLAPEFRFVTPTRVAVLLRDGSTNIPEGVVDLVAGEQAPVTGERLGGPWLLNGSTLLDMRTMQQHPLQPSAAELAGARQLLLPAGSPVRARRSR